MEAEMKRKVFKTGNSVVISLPKEALEFLRIIPGGDVSVDLDRENHQIVITPLKEPLEATGVTRTSPAGGRIHRDLSPRPGGPGEG
jgi:antitoxin component of MazEF toxin-antitoxin module